VASWDSGIGSRSPQRHRVTGKTWPWLRQVPVGNSRRDRRRDTLSVLVTAMKTDESRVRQWVVGVVVGCAISGILTATVLATRLAFYFPPFWPGLFLAWIVIIVSHGESSGSHFGILLATVGNAALYAWVSLRIIKAEVSAGGRVGRYLSSQRGDLKIS
jgi:hypothetical protein